ncbi:hypothetical protein I7I53_02836 [Histoplasma capsulatum var. duboisii H88]|uniref:Uncharacterized protein n=1 Tax=Ajellomyces capsulatus (strain H88) TaxID=544711 RepID=A0A8A1LSV2_AJEC8|nr:hypothetical protein I7I53_02836 [Histoplasma capsulatum var. duboisii H88]
MLPSICVSLKKKNEFRHELRSFFMYGKSAYAEEMAQNTPMPGKQTDGAGGSRALSLFIHTSYG